MTDVCSAETHNFYRQLEKNSFVKSNTKSQTTMLNKCKKTLHIF